MPFTWFHIVITSFGIVVQCHNRDTDIDTLYLSCSILYNLIICIGFVVNYHSQDTEKSRFFNLFCSSLDTLLSDRNSEYLLTHFLRRFHLLQLMGVF